MGNSPAGWWRLSSKEKEREQTKSDPILQWTLERHLKATQTFSPDQRCSALTRAIGVCPVYNSAISNCPVTSQQCKETLPLVITNTHYDLEDALDNHEDASSPIIDRGSCPPAGRDTSLLQFSMDWYNIFQFNRSESEFLQYNLTTIEPDDETINTLIEAVDTAVTELQNAIGGTTDSSSNYEYYNFEAEDVQYPADFYDYQEEIQDDIDYSEGLSITGYWIKNHISFFPGDEVYADDGIAITSPEEDPVEIVVDGPDDVQGETVIEESQITESTFNSTVRSWSGCKNVYSVWSFTLLCLAGEDVGYAVHRTEKNNCFLTISFIGLIHYYFLLLSTHKKDFIDLCIWPSFVSLADFTEWICTEIQNHQP